jgi:hypothetical protein
MPWFEGKTGSKSSTVSRQKISSPADCPASTKKIAGILTGTLDNSLNLFSPGFCAMIFRTFLTNHNNSLVF